MKPFPHPLVFRPVYKNNIWGGSRIASFPSRHGVPSPCGESWELSAHPDGLTSLETGESLADLTAMAPDEFIGSRASSDSRFPLLFKVIDAADRLSVQVHPNNANASLVHGEPKTEMWFVLDAAPGACLYAGLRPGVTPESFAAAIRAGTAADFLVRLDVHPGEALFIPGGLVHAIGAGCLIYEVQQSSNTTYRLYDWDRKGPDGKSRTLHVEQGLAAIDWSLPPPVMLPPPEQTRTGGNVRNDVISCDFFRMRRLDLVSREVLSPDKKSFLAGFTANGAVRVAAGGEEKTIPEKSSFLLPAGTGIVSLSPITSTATVLFTSLP